MIDKSKYALIWANGASFAEVFDLMKAEIELEISIHQMKTGNTVPARTLEEER